ncbi:MAG: hypothetical protein P1U42_04970 [Phycisphaerales bacterium]|nr:hypothetical protein [Phycisphaerales bacterium]
MESENTTNDSFKGTRNVEHHEQIRADRACIGCGFNLFGQPVVKEEHYNLAITRCPECGEVAAIQSYPTMSHWVNRFRVILGAGWVVSLLVAFAINSLIIMGLSFGSIDIASEKLSEEIGFAHSRWVEAQSLAAIEEQKRVKDSMNPVESDPVVINPEPDTTVEDPEVATIDPVLQNVVSGSVSTTINGITTTVTTESDGSTTTSTSINGVQTGSLMGGSYRWTTISNNWIENELGPMIEEKGGLWANVNREFLIMLIPISIVSTIAGIFWSVALLGSRRRVAIILPIVVSCIALVLVVSTSMDNSMMSYASEVARDHLVYVIGPLMVTSAAIFGLLGVFIGRSVARFVVLVSLPPRSRVSLSILWTRDGLELPKPKYK